MIRSMTGYGRGEFSQNDRKFTVEIKSVNHRYNDISIKSPRSMNYFEDKIKKRLCKDVFRGKTDVYVNIESNSSDDACIKLNKPLAEAYITCLSELEFDYGITSNDKLGLVAKFPDVVIVEKTETEADYIWNILSCALETAIENFMQMRIQEGEMLKRDLCKKTDDISSLLYSIKSRAPLVILEYKDKLQNRLKELLNGVEVDQQRIASEIAIFADRGCVDEEIIRLESHLTQMGLILNAGGQVGRKLDFLVQEMNRETNTIASKASDIVITNITIDMKSEIEKIREQVQNIE